MIECSICSHRTLLDPETIQALNEVIEEVLIPLINQHQQEANGVRTSTAIKGDDDQDDVELQDTEPFRPTQPRSIDSSL